jgi:hypothetical protein
VNDAEKLPCGCLMETQVIDGERTLIYVPCRLDCRYYLYTLEESARQGNRVTKLDAS